MRNQNSLLTEALSIYKSSDYQDKNSCLRFPATTWFVIFLLAHLFLWTVVPVFVRYNLPLDALEGTIWGHQLEWGYDKNPFLNGWLTALAVYFSSPTGWMVYLFSQLSVALCFWSVWQLAKHILAPTYALIAVLLLEGMQYFNFHAIDFNDNTLELSLWGLTAYCFYQALRLPLKSYHAFIYWSLTGCFAGLGMMTKYYTGVLLFCMLLLLCFNANNRKHLRTFAPYVGLLICFSIMLPHILWLFSHEFVTITYMLNRTHAPAHWSNHFFFPAQFAWQQLEVFLPTLALFTILLLGKKPVFTKPRIPLSSFNKDFLYYIGLGPFVLTLLLSLCLGIKLRAGWGMPLLSLWSILLLASLQPALTTAKVYRFIFSIFLLMGALLIGYGVSLNRSSDVSSANFPGKILADQITQQWHDRYHTKLAYIAGSRWISGNIAFYSKDRPAVFIEWNKLYAPWINTQQLREKGAVFVWDISKNKTVPPAVLQDYPLLASAQIIKLNLHRNHYHLPPIEVGIAFLPPASNQATCFANNC